jgi:hypothetical protein
MNLASRRILILSTTIIIASCNSNKVQETLETQKNKIDSIAIKEETKPEPVSITYRFEKKSIWKQKDSFVGYQYKEQIAAINRVDVTHLLRLDSFLVPDKYLDSLSDYMHFPSQSEALGPFRKIILFDYLTQTFAAYEYGKRVISGPTNMGKKATPTPTGLFYCNWKSKETRSTSNNEWILKWNFNVSNFGGVGFHEYALPGYPASHSCMRLWSSQAQFLYSWAEQWVLKDGKLYIKGTPVIIFGEYPFGTPRPWHKLVEDAHALDITGTALKAIIQPHEEAILLAQQERDNYLSQKSKDSTEKL